MRHLFLILPLALGLAACEPSAAERPAGDESAGAAPATLNVNGRPADPICFAPYLMREDAMTTISLDPATCAPGHTATTQDFSPIEGYTGTGFYMGDDADARGMRPAFIAYRVLGDLPDGRIALELMGSGGGTGVFSSLLTVTRKGNILRVVESVAGGDRCNGGLTDASVKDGRLAYAINVTPYDFLNLGTTEEAPGIAAYDDIPACAACCFGEALYEGKDFVGVRLNSEFLMTEEANDTPAQTCFNKIMSAQDKTEWTTAEYIPLRDRLRQECKPE